MSRSSASQQPSQADIQAFLAQRQREQAPATLSGRGAVYQSAEELTEPPQQKAFVGKGTCYVCQGPHYASSCPNQTAKKGLFPHFWGIEGFLRTQAKKRGAWTRREKDLCDKVIALKLEAEQLFPDDVVARAADLQVIDDVELPTTEPHK